jgi:hypothetical protein
VLIVPLLFVGDEVVASGCFVGSGWSPPTGVVPGAGCAEGAGCEPLPPDAVPEGACAVGVLAGAVPAGEPFDCAQTAADSNSANTAKTTVLKPMRSVALMTSPPPHLAHRCSASLNPLDVSIGHFDNK